MEDAVDALKMSASVMAFVIALAIVFSMFSQARAVSDFVLNHTDNTYYDTYVYPENVTANEGRVVGLESIVPTLYRYYREKFYIAMKNSSGNITELFDDDTERRVYRATEKDNTIVNLYPDKISWLANPNIDTQKRVTNYISGSNDAVNGTILNKYKNNGLWSKNSISTRNNTYIETFKLTENGSKIYPGEDGSIIYLVSGTKKVNLTYTKNDNI